MKVTIAGSAAVITSTLSLEDIKTVGKYAPESLTLYGGDSGKDPLFTIAVSAKPAGSICKYGAEFGTQTAEGGKATITIPITAPVADVKAFVADNYGGALANLAKLEEALPNVIEEICAARDAILASITIA